MEKKMFSVIAVTLLLTSMLTMAFKIKPVKAEFVGIELKYQTPYLLPKGLICVLVDSRLYNGIENSLRQYATDLEFIDGFSVSIYTVWGSNAEDIRALLMQALPEGLVGCLLVGDIPRASYYCLYPEMGTYLRFETEFYYMDLDGFWNDTDGDMAFDKHDGEVCAEIWVGSLQPSLVSGDEIWLLNNYFEKNHRYRTGILTLPQRELLYLDLYAEWGEWFVNATRIAYDEVVLVDDNETTNASDYRQRLDLESYEWIHLVGSGSPGSHTFMVHGHYESDAVSGYEYRILDPQVFFYTFMLCNGCRGYNNVAGSAVFADTYGLWAMGSRGSGDTGLPTHSVFPIYRTDFHEALSGGKCLGEAYLEDIKIYESMLAADPEYEIPGVEYMWQMVGDPSLHIHGYPLVTPPVITIVSPQNATYTANNIPLTFAIEQAVPWMAYSLDNQANVTIIGNTTLTGLSEGTHYITVFANDTVGNVRASETVYFTISHAMPVGGYSIPMEVANASELVLLHVALIAIATVVFTKLRPKTKRESY